MPRFVQCHNLTVNNGIVGQISQSFEIREYWRLKEFRRLENRFSLPPDFTAMARYPSNSTS